MLILLGVAVIVVGFAIRLNPLLVVLLAALTSGWFAGLSPLQVIAAFGHAFNENRFVSTAYLVLPLIGVLERAGLRERAAGIIAALKGVSVGRLLISYMALRQVTTAVGLVSIAGHAQTIRPLVAPMAEAAAEVRDGPPDPATRHAIRAMASATDNVAVFFSEDIFVAIGSVLLMVGFLTSAKIVMDPIHLSVWAIPSAVAAFVIHATRLMLFDRRLARDAQVAAAPEDGRMIKLGFVYVLAGLLYAAFALLSAGDRANRKRLGNTVFWGLVAVSFLAGHRLGDLGNGILVIGLALIAGFGFLGRGQPATTSQTERVSLAERFGNKLFLPALMLPLVVAIGVLLLKPVQLGGVPLMDPKQATLISLALAVIVGLGVSPSPCCGSPGRARCRKAAALVDTIGWAALLPQFLAALGAVFALAGVGKQGHRPAGR